MPNPLQSATPPDAPMPDAGPLASPQGTAPSQGGSPLQAGPQQQPVAPPSHAQTVATLRHLHAVNREFGVVLQNPNLGKSDVKSAVIDAVTKLTADRIVSPAAAVMLLTQVPDQPLDQRKWAQNFYDSNARAEAMVLDHHAAGGPASLDWGADQAGFTPPDTDNHMKTMDGVVAHYKGGHRA